MRIQTDHLSPSTSTDGEVHVTNDESLLVESRECSEQVNDELGRKIGAERVGRVYLQLACGLFIGLDDVRLCPTAAYNLVSQNLISEQFALCFEGNQSSLMIKKRKGKTTQFEFTKKFNQKRIILTKRPSFEALCDLRMDVAEEPPALHKSETPWKPTFRGARWNAYPDDVFKKARSLLNKITPSNTAKIIEEFCGLEVTTIDQLKELVEIVFEKAIRDPIYCGEYSMLIKKIYQICIPGETVRLIKFGNLLLEKVQTFFEQNRDLKDPKIFAERRKEIDCCKDEEKKRRLLDKLDDEILFSKKKSLANIKLIGALYLQNCLKSEIIDLVSLFFEFESNQLTRPKPSLKRNSVMTTIFSSSNRCWTFCLQTIMTFRWNICARY